MGRPTDAAEEFRRVMHRSFRIGIVAGEQLRRRRHARQILHRASTRGGLRNRRLEDREGLPDFEECHVVEYEGSAYPRGDRMVLRTTDRHELRPGAAFHQTAALELAQRFAHGGPVDAELARELGLRGQAIALAQAAAENALRDGRGHLAVRGLDENLVELHAHAAASNSSRPISMRRISCVPAPIS